MGIYLEEKEEKNYQAFMDELEKISKKYGIAFEGCGVFVIYYKLMITKTEYIFMSKYDI